MKVLKILQSFSQGTFIAFVLLVLCCGRNFAEPGYLDFDNLPETNFTCAGKVIGGYYADLEASCQMFHVCTIGQGDEPMDIKFLCLNGTVFDQETRVCERVDEVDCTKSERFYYLNLELYGNTIIPAPEESSSEEVSGSASSPSPSTTSATTSTTSSSTTTTKRPTTTTPSRRFIFNNSKGSPIVSSTTLATPTHSYSTTTSKSPEEEDEYEYDDDDYEEKDGPAGGSALPAIEEDGSFSPQQFTLQQQTQNSQPKPDDPAKTGTKPAVSFQQQHFQNGGTLAVTNSHVTVTTHTTSSNANPSPSQQKKLAQQFVSQKEKQALEHQKQQQAQALAQQQMITKQHQELQKKQQEAAVQQQQKAIQQQAKQVQQHDAEIKNHQALLLLHQQKINRQQQQQKPTTAKPQPVPNYNPYESINNAQQQQQPQTHAPKRIPLLSAANPQPTLVQTSQQQQQQQQRPAPPPPSAASQLAPFRLRAQGFKLPSQQPARPDSLEQEDRFEGYRRQPPPQVSLHLPFEQLRQQKDISLQFDSDIEDLSQFPQHKELKRSDPPFHSSIHPSSPAPPATATVSSSSPKPPNSASATPAAPTEDGAGAVGGFADDPVEYEYEDYSSEAGGGGDPASNPSLDSVKSNTNSEIVVSKKRSGEGQLGDGQQIGAGQQQQQPGGPTSLGSNSSKGKANTSRFIINNEHHKSPTSLYNRGRSSNPPAVYDSRPATGTKPRASYQSQAAPKVIVTTSTSIRDNNGRTINYSINSSSSTSSPASLSSGRRGYDEYKEDDVLTDPFFLDVPKVAGGRRRRSVPGVQRKRRRRVIYIVPRFM